jgi:citronellol/citronellal dehydrogenase
MGRADGRIAIVTGASRGIGKAIAQRLATEGARVVCAARTLEQGQSRLEGSLAATVAEIKSAGGEAAAVRCDLAQPADCERLVEQTQRIYGPCDLLVNNAAMVYFIPVKDYPVDRWMKSFAINFHAPFILSRLVLPEMVARRFGAIINISSAGAIGPGRGPYSPKMFRDGTCYGASKAALERFTQGLAHELYEHGIAVSCVAPSEGVVTPGMAGHGLLDELKGRRREPPEHMAQAVLLLATEPLDKVTGRVTYSQQLLKEYGLLPDAHGIGVDHPGSGYSRM